MFGQVCSISRDLMSFASSQPEAWTAWRRAPVFIVEGQTLWRHQELDQTIIEEG